MKIHFVYAKGDSISTPFAITNELAARLRKRFEVEVYDWLEQSTIRPDKGDILLGHPHPFPGTIFRNSFFQNGWSKRIILSPFAHGIPKYVAWLDPLVAECDRYLAICGRYWSDTIENTLFSHWRPKLEQVDLAVNRDHFPLLKRSFSPIGRRRFLNIGRVADYKGMDVLERIAERSPECEFAWIGGGALSGNSIRVLGPQDFSSRHAQELVSSFDFLIHCGRSDANPTTILEAASWGLIPVCTPQSGYYREEWIRNIPLDDVEAASRIIGELNAAPEEDLVRMQQAGHAALERHYNWDRFAEQVLNALDAPPVPGAHSFNSPNRRELARIAARDLAMLRCQHYVNRMRILQAGAKRRIVKLLQNA